MATLWITEFADCPRDARGQAIAAPDFPEFPEATVQVLEITDTSTQSAEFGGGTNFVLLSTTGDCSYTIGKNPVATTSHTPLFALAQFFVGVRRGLKLAVISQ